MAQPPAPTESFILSLSFDPVLELTAEQKAKIQETVSALIKGGADYLGGFVYCVSTVAAPSTLPSDVEKALASVFPGRQITVAQKEDVTALTFEEVGNIPTAPLAAVNDVHTMLLGLQGQPVIQPEGVIDVLFSRQPPEVDPSWPIKTIKDLNMQTGDVILFAGTHPKSVQIRQVQWSRYSHTALVFREDNGKIMILQSNGDHGVTYDDAEQYLVNYHGQVVHRKLNLNDDYRPALATSLRTFKEYALGAPYTHPVTFVALYFETVLRGKGVPVKTRAFFCSQLVARAFQEARILEDRPYASVYIPERFANDALPFLLGASLSSPPTRINQSK